MKKKHQKLYILTKTVHLVKKLTKSNDFPRRRGKSDFYISLRDLKMDLMKQIHLFKKGFMIFLKGAPFSDFIETGL